MKIVQAYDASDGFQSLDGRLTLVLRGFIISKKRSVLLHGKVTFPNGNSHVFKEEAHFAHQILLDSIYEPI